MTLIEFFNAAKTGALPLIPVKAIFVPPNPALTEAKLLTEAEIIVELSKQEVQFFDTVAEGFGLVFLGSTVYLSEGMQLCDSFEEFVINVSGW